MIFRIIMFLYILPLMAVSAIFLIFQKSNFIKYLWLYSTLAILFLIIFAKAIFAIIGLIE